MKTFKFTLEVDLDIDGVTPSDDILISRLIDAMNEGFPRLVFDDEELDCIVFVNSWQYIPSAEIKSDDEPRDV